MLHRERDMNPREEEMLEKLNRFAAHCQLLRSFQLPRSSTCRAIDGQKTFDRFRSTTVDEQNEVSHSVFFFVEVSQRFDRDLCPKQLQ